MTAECSRNFLSKDNILPNTSGKQQYAPGAYYFHTSKSVKKYPTAIVFSNFTVVEKAQLP